MRFKKKCLYILFACCMYHKYMHKHECAECASIRGWLAYGSSFGFPPTCAHQMRHSVILKGMSAFVYARANLYVKIPNDV